jgi:hypothetical protein
MSTTLPVTYSHLIEGFTKGVDRGGPFYRVIYRIADWGQSDAFVNALMGVTSVTGSASKSNITRTTPHQHPLSTNTFCESATVIQGLGNPVLNANGYPDYDGGALIQAEYRVPPYDYNAPPNSNQQIDPNTPLTYCTQRLSYTTEVFTVNSGLADKPPAKIQLGITIMSLTFHDLPYLPTQPMQDLAGKVNSATFLGAAAGLVLYKGGDTDRKLQTDGSTVQEISMTFHKRQVGFEWNKLPSKTNPYTWTTVTDSNGNSPFLTGDLNTLLF